MSCLLVEHGEDREASARFRAFAEASGWEYVHACGNNAAAINAGIRAARTEFVLLEDIDLVHVPDFYEDISETILPSWDERPFNFYSFPVAYLSEAESRWLCSDYRRITRRYLHKIKDSLECGDPEQNPFLQRFVPQSSLILVKKSTAEFVGLFDESFEDWGGEDRDFVFRLLAVNPKIRHNADFGTTSTESGPKISRYVGWKALWTLHGDFAWNRDLLAFHLYHEERPWRKKRSARGSARETIRYAARKARTIGTRYQAALTPCAPPGCPNFVFGRTPFLFHPEVYEALGGFQLIEDHEDVQAILKRVGRDSRILFWNPWGSPKTLDIYENLKTLGFQVLAAKRGPLPGSVIIDPDGPASFAQACSKTAWMKPLTQAEALRTESRIRELRRAGGGNAEDSPILTTRPFRKAVLVLFQSPEDGALHQGALSYEVFVRQMEALQDQAPDDLLLLFKNHPLAREKVRCTRALCVDEADLHALLEAVDCVALYNGPSALLATLHEKPVVTFGPQACGDDPFTVPLKDAAELVPAVLHERLPAIRHEEVLAFFSHLMNDVYCFVHTDGPDSRETEPLSYEQIINPFDGSKKRFCSSRFDPEASLLFKRFFHEEKRSDAASKKPGTKASSSRLLRKLLTNPRAYFSDSRYPIRFLRFFFAKK